MVHTLESIGALVGILTQWAMPGAVNYLRVWPGIAEAQRCRWTLFVTFVSFVPAYPNRSRLQAIGSGPLGVGAVEISNDGAAQTVWLSTLLLPQNNKNVANWLEMAKSSITPQSIARKPRNRPLVRSHSQKRRCAWPVGG
jgi:hypothetical protein